MNKEIAQILELAKQRVELSNHFNIKQGIILDAIQEDNIELLTNALERPLTMIEQGMVLDYKLHWEMVNTILNERKEKQSQLIEGINSIKIGVEKELELQKTSIPIEFRAQIDRLSNKPYSTKKEVVLESSINFDETILNENIAPVLGQNTGEIIPLDVIEKISLLNFNIPVTYLVQLLEERQYNMIQDVIERELETDELVELHSIRKSIYG